MKRVERFRQNYRSYHQRNLATVCPSNQALRFCGLVGWFTAEKSKQHIGVHEDSVDGHDYFPFVAALFATSFSVCSRSCFRPGKPPGGKGRLPNKFTALACD